MTHRIKDLTLSDPYPVPSGKVARGTAQVPASKSLAHRALICAALAEGTSTVGPFPAGEDGAATLACLRALGVGIEKRGTGSGEQGAGSGDNVLAHPASRLEPDTHVLVRGTGGALVPPREPLHCGASGTTLRLLMGVCGAVPGSFTLDGTEQLR